MGKDIKTIKIDLSVDKEELDFYGGEENYKMLIEDILNRYSYAEYFDEDLVDIILNKDLK